MNDVWILFNLQNKRPKNIRYRAPTCHLSSLIEISRRFRSTEPVELFFVYQKKRKNFVYSFSFPFALIITKLLYSLNSGNLLPFETLKRKQQQQKTIAYKTGHKLSNIFKCARHWNATMDEYFVFYYFSICTFKGQTDGQQQQPIILSHTKGEETEGHLSTSEILSFHKRRGE